MDHEKLRTLLKERGVSASHVAQLFGITRQAFYTRMRNKREFKAGEMLALVEDMRMTPEEADAIFYPESRRKINEEESK